MPRPRKSLGDASKLLTNYSTDAADAVNAARDLQRKSVKIEAGQDNVTIALPNGETRGLAETLALIDHEYIQEDIKSIYADPHDYLEHVKPDHMYAWPSMKDPMTLAKIRSGMYRPVELEELRKDSATPIEVKAKAGIDFVCIGDVALVEIPPRGVAKMYRSREAQAVLRTARNQSYEALKRNVEHASNGLVQVEMESHEL